MVAFGCVCRITEAKMLHIGCHLSASKGYLAMGREALSIGADTFQYFSRNPRGGNAKAFDANDASALIAFMNEHDFAPVVTHAPYTLNPCAANPDVLDFARRALREDLTRLEFFPGALYNLHPGSHVGQGAETGIKKISEILNEVLTREQSTTVLLETMSGKGSEVGRNFQELRQIIDRVEYKEKLGICLDTCHVWDGGYDIVNNLDGVLEEFDRIIGLEKLKAIHLNDSLNDLGSHKDRHARIGEGRIGLEALVRVIRHPCLERIPFILETPNDDEGWAAEIRTLREAYEKS